ncbi:MAG: hypothetical protein ACI8R4_000886 [Paracoccaceae bacterium]
MFINSFSKIGVVQVELIRVFLASARACDKVDTCATPARSPEVFGVLTRLPDDAGIWHAAVARPSVLGLEPFFFVR